MVPLSPKTREHEPRKECVFQKSVGSSNYSFLRLAAKDRQSTIRNAHTTFDPPETTPNVHRRLPSTPSRMSCCYRTRSSGESVTCSRGRGKKGRRCRLHHRGRRARRTGRLRGSDVLGGEGQGAAGCGICTAPASKEDFCRIQWDETNVEVMSYVFVDHNSISIRV